MFSRLQPLTRTCSRSLHEQQGIHSHTPIVCSGKTCSTVGGNGQFDCSSLGLTSIFCNFPPLTTYMFVVYQSRWFWPFVSNSLLNNWRHPSAFDSNSITTVSTNALGSLTLLSNLYLYSNAITYIATNAFIGLPQLSLLFVSPDGCM